MAFVQAMAPSHNPQHAITPISTTVLTCGYDLDPRVRRLSLKIIPHPQETGKAWQDTVGVAMIFIGHNTANRRVIRSLVVGESLSYGKYNPRMSLCTYNTKQLCAFIIQHYMQI